MAKTRAAGGGFGRVLVGFLLGVLTAGAAGFAYLKYEGLTVAPMNKPLLTGKHVVSPPPMQHTGEDKRVPPFGASEDAFEAGAHVYRARCASCHGAPGHDAALARSMNPAAAQLWKGHGKHGVAEGSGHDPGEIYGKVANGIRLTGMPAYKHVLSETEMWQVSLLLANADKALPNPVTRILTEP